MTLALLLSSHIKEQWIYTITVKSLFKEKKKQDRTVTEIPNIGKKQEKALSTLDQ